MYAHRPVSAHVAPASPEQGLFFCLTGTARAAVESTRRSGSRCWCMFIAERGPQAAADVLVLFESLANGGSAGLPTMRKPREQDMILGPAKVSRRDAARAQSGRGTLPGEGSPASTTRSSGRMRSHLQQRPRQRRGTGPAAVLSRALEAWRALNSDAGERNAGFRSARAVLLATAGW